MKKIRLVQQDWQNGFANRDIQKCTDICVISNAMTIKAFNPEVEISVDAGCCAGVTPQSHKTALDAMKGCQIRIEE